MSNKHETDWTKSDTQFLPRREHGGFNYIARQGNVGQEDNHCLHKHTKAGFMWRSGGF